MCLLGRGSETSFVEGGKGRRGERSGVAGNMICDGEGEFVGKVLVLEFLGLLVQASFEA